MTGDVAQPAKRDPELKAALDRIEGKALDDMGMTFALNDLDRKRLKYLDRLDAYLWAYQNTPHVLDANGWPEDAAWLHSAREELFL